MELGPEPPALVNLLVHAGDLSAEAVPATLLDLAARRRIELFEAAPGQVACRLRPSSDAATDPLLPYEQQVYEAVRDAAPSGSVPIASLSAAMHPDSAAFWGRFRARVRNDALGRGLLGGHFTLHALFALLPQVLFAAGLTVIFPPGVIIWMPLALVLWLVSVVLVARGTSRLLSDDGRRAASRWLGVRDFIARDDAFHTLPPASVAVWDRYLAYGAAMGVAKDATRGLLLEFRTRATRTDREHAMDALRDPLAAITALPADLRPGARRG